MYSSFHSGADGTTLALKACRTGVRARISLKVAKAAANGRSFDCSQQSSPCCDTSLFTKSGAKSNWARKVFTIFKFNGLSRFPIAFSHDCIISPSGGSCVGSMMGAGKARVGRHGTKISPQIGVPIFS